MKLKDYLSNRPFLNIGSEISEITEEFKIELKEFYDLDDSDNKVKIIGFKNNLLKRFIDTVYRDFILVEKNLAIYNSIDVRLYNGGKKRECEFLELIRDNTWTKVVILSYGLFSNSKNDFYSFNNLISIIESNYSISLNTFKDRLKDIHNNELDTFKVLKMLRNKIHGHRDIDTKIIFVPNDVISPLLILGHEIFEYVIKSIQIIPCDYSIERNLHDYNGECIWYQIDLDKIY